MPSQGIWIARNNGPGTFYTTWLKNLNNDPFLAGRVPFENQYDPEYLGSAGFVLIDREPIILEIPDQFEMHSGLFQSHFYPFGENPERNHPLLLKKGLARRIEAEIAKDLLRRFPRNTPLTLAAHEPSHKTYLAKIGLESYKIMTLQEYSEILQKSIR